MDAHLNPCLTLGQLNVSNWHREDSTTSATTVEMLDPAKGKKVEQKSALRLEDLGISGKYCVDIFNNSDLMSLLLQIWKHA